MHLAVLQNINSTREIVLEQLPAARGSVHTGQDTWICVRIDHPIDLWKQLHIADLADISVKHVHAESLQRSAVRLPNPGASGCRFRRSINLQCAQLNNWPSAAGIATDSRDQNSHWEAPLDRFMPMRSH